MSTLDNIASVAVATNPALPVSVSGVAVTVNVPAPTATTVNVLVPDSQVATIGLPGPQGVPGLQNVVVSTTTPPTPFEGLIWMDIS